MNDDNSQDIWKDDRLGYRAVGAAFTNLIQSIDDQKVISIEAGFGRGKTFFRKAWAQQLRAAGEVVIEVDVRMSDHSGDPVVTLLGAIAGAVQKKDSELKDKAMKTVRQLAVVGSKAALGLALRQGADAVFDAVSEAAQEKLEGYEQLQQVVMEADEQLSRAASELIRNQLAAEKVRDVELPASLRNLKKSLASGRDVDRVVIIVDELDRCHPDYAIAFLEAAKIVFHQTDFTFCLMVNERYIENLAKHRFGPAEKDELYLDKFVDLRLKLAPAPDAMPKAVRELVERLPNIQPIGEHQEFSARRAAELASEMATQLDIGMRQIKRIMLKIDVALRCSGTTQVDLPLLVFLAFKDSAKDRVSSKFLPRADFTETRVNHLKINVEKQSPQHWKTAVGNAFDDIRRQYPEILSLEFRGRGDAHDIDRWNGLVNEFGPNYVKSHEEILNGSVRFIEFGE